MRNGTSPKISVVVTARNDNHGGNLLRRMQVFVDALVEQAERHGLDCELIIVEWNPPFEAPRLAEALVWPPPSDACKVRIIEVPTELHCRYRFSDKLPLFQMIAKNVGVRRARGQYVLCTNIDLVFSDELVRFLASGDLDRHCLYRVNRLDVPAGVLPGVPVATQLEYCRRHVIRVNNRWGTFHRGSLTVRSLMNALRPSRTTRAGPRRDAPRSKPVSRGLRPLRWLAGVPGKIRRLMVNQARRGWFRPLHTNACGDFTLLARQRWEELRGYPELEMFSFYLDAILCHMAVLSGAREVVLRRRLCAYHIEHASGWSPQEGERLFSRVRAMGVPMLDVSGFYEWIDRMKRDRASIVVNGEHWGMAREQLSEVDPTLLRQARGRVSAFATPRDRM